MKTVKEVSELTGISVRALHYYDEIGLLRPTEKSEAGYRLYDDKALEKIQQILFFREFDISLKEIKEVMNHPSFDRNEILKMQRNMLVAKKERMERLIASIDDILKGENKMDFEVFTKSELEEICQITMDRMPEFLQKCIVQEFGGMEQWKEHYIERASKQDMQKGYQKMVEWYGDKENVFRAMTNPPGKEVVEAYEKRFHVIMKKLADKMDQPVDSFEVKSIIGEYGFVMKQLYHLKNEEGYMLATASGYKNERAKSILDQKYGEGFADFLIQAVERFYIKQQ